MVSPTIKNRQMSTRMATIRTTTTWNVNRINSTLGSLFCKEEDAVDVPTSDKDNYFIMENNNVALELSDPISVLSFLQTSGQHWTQIGSNEEASMWLFQHFVKDPSKPLSHIVGAPQRITIPTMKEK